MRIKLAGHPWRALSPSRFVLQSHADVVLRFDGKSWRLWFDGIPGPHAFPCRDAAAGMVADGINAWQEQWA